MKLHFAVRHPAVRMLQIDLKKFSKVTECDSTFFVDKRCIFNLLFHLLRRIAKNRWVFPSFDSD